jgi:hypothetical protein
MTRILRIIRQLGCFNAFLLALSRVIDRSSGGRWRLQRYLFVAQVLPTAPLCAGRGRDIRIRLLTESAAVPEGCPRPHAVVRDRYRQGAQALAAFREERLAGFLWFVFGAYQEDEVRAHFSLPSPDCVWDFDVWVRPEERLGWTFRRLWEAARLLLRARGARWSCSRISAFNAASLRAHAAIGTTRLGSAIFLNCGNWQWMLATMPPYAHLSRSADAVPNLLIMPKEPICPISTKSASS